ncbi:hypothetical protein JCM10296v2_000884 [Rhodotorula toruloides]
MNLPVHGVTRRTGVLACLAVVCLLLLVHSSASSRPLIPLPQAVRFRSTSKLARYLAHPSEGPALPLVSSISSFSLSPPPPSQPVNVSICAVPTHEEQYLPEWITWHRLVGVERFYLFDNSPSRRMRRLLKPWIDEGSVVLYELHYKEGTDIGAIYQQHVLRLCEKDVLPHTNWASHHDVDEFLLVDAPGWSSPLPTPVSAPSTSSDSPALATRWTFPLHTRFNEILHRATCVPILRLPFQNYGVRELGWAESVVERQTVRDKVDPIFHTYGKIFLHSAQQAKRASWMGPHSCKALPGTVVLDSHGKRIVNEEGIYPFNGLALPQESLRLFHYVQRSLEDCRSKYRVLANTPNDWRTKDGLTGCARNYVPLDSELATPEGRDELAALVATDSEEERKALLDRPASWWEIFERDTAARDSWQGRMTRAVLAEWRARGKREGVWWWEEGVEDEELDAMEGVRVVRDIERAIMGA